MDIEQALTEFREEMLRKFKERAARHPEDDIVVNGTRRLEAVDIGAHLWLEVQEWVESPNLGESVDVADMAFLAWWLCKEHGADSLLKLPGV